MPFNKQPPPKPQPPLQSDCCGSDCAPHCVFDIYDRDLERWQEEFALWQAQQPNAEHKTQPD